MGMLDDESVALLDELHWFQDQMLGVEYSRHVNPPEWWAKCVIGPGIVRSVDNFPTPSAALAALRGEVEQFIASTGEVSD